MEKRMFAVPNDLFGGYTIFSQSHLWQSLWSTSGHVLFHLPRLQHFAKSQHIDYLGVTDNLCEI